MIIFQCGHHLRIDEGRWQYSLNFKGIVYEHTSAGLGKN